MSSRAEIMNGSSLTVREGQMAILSKDGKIADIFPPGRHRLETANLPVLTTLMNWNKGFRSPFVCEVHFVNTYEQLCTQNLGLSTVNEREVTTDRGLTFDVVLVDVCILRELQVV
jgi:membrane protease subunit (stomatin/prohibitin family)